MLVDSDQASQRQMIAALSSRGHRAVPVNAEEASELAQRLRFNAVFWAARNGNGRTGEYQERVRSLPGCFVLMTDAFDSDLAARLEEAGGYILVRPIQDADLNRVLAQIESEAPNASAGRAGR